MALRGLGSFAGGMAGGVQELGRTYLQTQVEAQKLRQQEAEAEKLESHRKISYGFQMLNVVKDPNVKRQIFKEYIIKETDGVLDGIDLSDTFIDQVVKELGDAYTRYEKGDIKDDQLQEIYQRIAQEHPSSEAAQTALAGQREKVKGLQARIDKYTLSPQFGLARPGEEPDVSITGPRGLEHKFAEVEPEIKETPEQKLQRAKDLATFKAGLPSKTKKAFTLDDVNKTLVSLHKAKAKMEAGKGLDPLDLLLMKDSPKLLKALQKKDISGATKEFDKQIAYYETLRADKSYVIGKTYPDAKGRKAKYLGKGKWRILKK